MFLSARHHSDVVRLCLAAQRRFKGGGILPGNQGAKSYGRAGKDIGTERERIADNPNRMWTDQGYEPNANHHMQFSPAGAGRMGRRALVVGGTGLIGKHICHELALRQVHVFSISRRGGILEEELNYLERLDEVTWIEGDVKDAGMWADLRPVLKDLQEVHICLPRTLEGAYLALTAAQQIKEAGVFPLCFSLVTVPRLWPNISSTAHQAWERTETFIRTTFPRDHLFVRPGNVHGNDVSNTRQFYEFLRQKAHKYLLTDTLTGSENVCTSFQLTFLHPPVRATVGEVRYSIEIDVGGE